MALEQNKRPKRTPLTPEEVANVIAFKKRRDLNRRIKLKNSLPYKLQNMFNVCCFFISCELIFCFLFPTNYTQYFSKEVKVQYGDEYRQGTRIVSKINVSDSDGKEYDIIVDDFIEIAEKNTFFFIAKDYLLQKELKGRLDYFTKDYTLYAASPILLLCTFVLIVSVIVYRYNLNENAHSLTALTVLNAIILLGITSF